MKIVIWPFGNIDPVNLNSLNLGLRNIFKADVRTEEKREVPLVYFNKSRQQFFSTPLVELTAELTGQGETSLGITDGDLFVPEMNFVFGEADLGGKSAVISVARLDQAYYGLPSDEKLLSERTLKEGVHELGHVLGLRHCPNPGCIMHFSNSIADTDIKGPGFCQKCKIKLKDHLHPIPHDHIIY